jgi:serine/threonine-protein kinase
MSTGREFVGPYRLFHLIRAGALFEIWAVRPVAENTVYAMKWLPPGNQHSRVAAAELKHEYSVGKTLDHPAVIKTYDYGTSKDGTYMVMEFFKTPNLKQQINEGTDKLHYRLEAILTAAAKSLDYMHEQGWVHRDIKPDNYLVREDNEVRLIDFNLSQRIKKRLAKMFSGKSKVQGTYSYMSPEQIRGKTLDERADIYSFGCMVYELLTGKLPFTANNSNELLNKHLKAKPPQLSVLNNNIQSEFAALVHRMLAKDPADRPDSLKEFLLDLKRGRCFYIKPKPPELEEDIVNPES